MTRPVRHGTRTPAVPGVLVLVALGVLVVLVALATGSTRPPAAAERSPASSGTATPGAVIESATGPATGAEPPGTTTPGDSATPPTTRPTGVMAAPLPPGLPTTVEPVRPGELTRFVAMHGSTVILDAPSSGVAHYAYSDRCEVPGQPCYDAPTLDQVARIDLGAPPTVPGTQTTFVTGHSNRFHPSDPSRGVFTRLLQVRTGDTLVLTTTAGEFVYTVTQVLEVPFDRLTSTPEVVTVRPDTVVAISCVIPPDRSAYTGNYVVIGSLRSSRAG